MKKVNDKYGNTKPVQIESNEWWWNGCIIQDQRDMPHCLPNFVIMPDDPDRNVLDEDMGNIKTANTFKEAISIAYEWGNTFTSYNTAKSYL